MKILKLEIENVRGIRKKITLTPNGENMVIYGPNGTGKSAVVDSIDFLFTGDISRLTGRGTLGMSLKNHGKHIDAQSQDAVVRATVKIDGIEGSIDLERKISNPNELIYPDIKDKRFNDVLDVAQNGQHILSRIEILKYITAEASKSAEEIQAILNLSIVEEIRKTLVNIKNDADRDLQKDEVSYEKSKSIIGAILELEKFSEAELLKKVNEFRKILKGSPILALDPEIIQEGISPLSGDDKARVDPEELKRNIASVNELVDQKGLEIYQTEGELRLLIKKLNEDDKLRRDLANKRLLELGISLIDETGSCPLCLTQWGPGRLEPFLKNRLSKSIEAEETEKNISAKATQINNVVIRLKTHVCNIVETFKQLKQEDMMECFDEWTQKLNVWSDNLTKATEYYHTDNPDDSIKAFLKPSNWEKYSVKLLEIAETFDKLTPEQKAWDTLTTLKQELKRYCEESEKLKISKGFADKAGIVSKTYNETKDKVLEELYRSVNDDFTEYYKKLHGEDEKNFFSEIKPDGSQLDFKVDFYGRGKHHPRALHSEGHQDSMGLCLYLALYKKISEQKVKLVVLDDVVMSIDSGHRRNICRLLRYNFPNQQFIITTHNRTWARQLTTDGVINKKNMVEFRSWSIDTGPKYSENGDIWGEIYKKLNNNNISSAAHLLREHTEFFYEYLCDSLSAPVRYKGDGRYELGDYLNGIRNAYKENLKQAKKAANSWGNEEELENLIKIESQANEIIQRTQMEHWAINENIHYSKWADFTKDDFLPILEAFQDLEVIFSCSNCGGVITLNQKNNKPSNVTCPCGNIFWNLNMMEI